MLCLGSRITADRCLFWVGGAGLPNYCWQMTQKSPKLGRKGGQRLPVCESYFILERYALIGRRSLCFKEFFHG